MSKSLNLYAGTAIGIGVTLTAAYNFADRSIAALPESPRMMAALPAPIPEPEKPVDTAAAAAPAASGGLIAAAHASAEPGDGLRFGLGRAALPEEIAAWDVDVRPDGTGLPEGSGNAFDGEAIFEEACAVCHGSFAEGVDNWPKLAGGDGTLADEDPLKTVGSYWPYLSTVFDYVNRSMPFGAAQTLTADEVYAITAYILYSNDLIDDEFELSRETFLDVEMPNAGGFIVDDRAETEYSIWRTEPCMENCKDGEVQITMRATVLDVTPDEEGGEDHSAMEATATEPTTEVAAAATTEAPAAEAEVVAAAADAVDPALIAEGEKVFGKCKACHQVGEGAKNRSGPHLNALMGRAIGGVDGFKYSKTMGSMGGEWNAETLAAFLADPRGYVKGTKMSFAGLKKDEDIAAVTAYLSTFTE